MNNKQKTQGFFGKIDGNILRLLIILIGVIILAATTKTSLFLKVDNFRSIGKQLTEYGLMSLGVGICMISGGIDLSSVYVANLSGIIAGLMMRNMITTSGSNEMSIVLLSIVAGLVVGTLCGIFNGLLISVLNIPPMLATLGTYQLYMGIAIVISGGSTVSGIAETFTAFGTTLLFGIPAAFWVFVLASIVLALVMRKTKFGMRVYLVGTNAKASLFAGIRNRNIIIRTYMISGFLAAVAGLISLARINSAKADFGSSYTMQSILIVVLGGVNPNGGFGSITGVAIAVVILQAISSYLNMFPNISNYYRDLLWGVALIAVLIINYIIDKQKILKMSKSS